MTALAYLQQLPAAASLLQLSRPIRVVVQVRLSHRHQADSDKADSLFLVLGSVRSLRQAMADVSPDARATPAPQSFLPFDTVPHPPPPPSQGTSDANAARKRRQAPAVGARPSASRAGTLYPICRLGSVSSGGEDASCRRLLWRCGAASHFRSPPRLPARCSVWPAYGPKAWLGSASGSAGVPRRDAGAACRLCPSRPLWSRLGFKLMALAGCHVGGACQCGAKVTLLGSNLASVTDLKKN